MESTRRGMVSGSRVVLPTKVRNESGIQGGSEVVSPRTPHGIEIKTLAEVVHQTQTCFAHFINSVESDAGDLIRDRPPIAERE